jgi:DNA (cytosine-5)-methyltransferase 1
MRHRSGESREGGQPEQFDQNGIEGGDVADTEFIRLQYGSKTGQVLPEERDAKAERCKSSLPIKTNGYGFKPNWQNFPTVSPICTGDDGISNRLDSITFPKWRNESIKAGGNAIVPQVVYQIFKTIEKYENLQNL